MKIAPNFDQFILFILLVFPGLISMHIYRLLMPAKDIDWKNSIFEALFYSSINFGILLPLILVAHQNEFTDKHPYLYAIIMYLTIFVGPIVWPCLWTKLIKNKKLMSKLQLPFPTAWDFFFDKRETVFVLVHLKNGNKIGGYFGEKSYATSYPREGDFYIEKAIKVDQSGVFLEVVKDSYGILIRKDEYELIEFFRTEQKTEKKGEETND